MRVRIRPTRSGFASQILEKGRQPLRLNLVKLRTGEHPVDHLPRLPRGGAAIGIL